jgi:hypothetical protein
MNQEISMSHTEKLNQVAKTKSFLGREFLTWLWCFVDLKSEDSISVNVKGQKRPITVSLWIDDKIVLDSNSGIGHRHVMRGGDPAQSPEASIALATGKTVRELKLGMNIIGVGDFSTNLNSSDLNPRSIQLPGDDNLGEAEENAFLPAQQRIKQISLLLAVIDELFARFVNERISDNWVVGSQNDIKEWIAGRSSNVSTSIKHIIH